MYVRGRFLCFLSPFAFWCAATNEEEELRKARIASNRAARRKRIKAHTATLDDYQAEIAAQEHELAAAVQKQSEIDSKLNAADTDKKEYEKELKKCEQKLAAKQSRADIVKLERKKERLEASIAVEGRKQSRLLDQSEPLDARIKELHANIAELKQHLGAWHDLTYTQFAIALVMSFSLPPPSPLSFFGLPSTWVLTTAVQFIPCLILFVFLFLFFFVSALHHITHTTSHTHPSFLQVF